MKQASVAELKARLSEYLAAARRGEDVIVTDRGRPVARLSGLDAERQLEARVSELVRAGVMRPPQRQLGPSFWDTVRPTDARGASLDALLAERAEGR